MHGYWENRTGKPEDEKYYIVLQNNPVLAVQINPKFYRPAEVELLLGNSTKAREELGWKPHSSFGTLVEKMIRNDLEYYEV
jgi:GDPmannose 4,6-dehydratase